jgi:SH3 domain-containing protein
VNIKLLPFPVVLWLVALLIMTGCSPYLESPVATPTAARPALIATVDPPQLFAEGDPTPPPTCTVHVGSVYLRAGAGMQHAVLEVLHDGQILTVLARGAWLKVETRTKTGFIYSKYCR